MKKLLLSAAILLMLTSCGSSAAQPQYPIAINSSVKAVYQDTDYEADVVSTPDGKITVVMISPAELNGFKMIIVGENVTVEKDDIQVNYPSEALRNSPFTVLSKVVRELNSRQPIFGKTGQELSASFDVDNSVCTIRFNTEKNYITYIQIEEFKFAFYQGGD